MKPRVFRRVALPGPRALLAVMFAVLCIASALTLMLPVVAVTLMVRVARLASVRLWRIATACGRRVMAGVRT